MSGVEVTARPRAVDEMVVVIISVSLFPWADDMLSRRWWTLFPRGSNNGEIKQISENSVLSPWIKWLK